MLSAFPQLGYEMTAACTHTYTTINVLELQKYYCVLVLYGLV